MAKRIFITGAAGFIGSHLAQVLKHRGDFVIGLDNFNMYYSTKLKDARAKILKDQNVEIIKGDIRDKELLEKIVEENKITHIVNLAAQAGVRYCITNPGTYLDNNIDGFLSVLEVCRAHPSLKLVYASSSSVYGLNEKVPFSEEDRTDTQASLYGTTKKMNELMAQNYSRLFGFCAIGLRFFTAYGPWGRPDMAYFSFTEKILKGETIALYNHGQMVRDFTYIDDIIQGIVAAIDVETTHRVFNLGNNQPVSLIEFIETLEMHLGKKAKKELLPIQPGDVPITYADISLSKEVLGFSPKTSIQEGLKHFIDWHKSYIKGS